jgi:hypothetical protein
MGKKDKKKSAEKKARVAEKTARKTEKKEKKTPFSGGGGGREIVVADDQDIDAVLEEYARKVPCELADLFFSCFSLEIRWRLIRGKNAR